MFGLPVGKTDRLPFENLARDQPLRMIRASTIMDSTKAIQIEGSPTKPNQPIIFSLTATNAKLT